MTTVLTTSSVVRNSTVEVTITSTALVTHIKGVEPLTTLVETVTDSEGQVSTRTVTVHDTLITSTEYDSDGHPTKTATAFVYAHALTTTLKDSLGYPTATVDFYIVNSLVTLFDSNHVATATTTTQVPETLKSTTLTNSNGIPTKTTAQLQPITYTTVVYSTPSTSSSSIVQQNLRLKPLSDGQYFAGLILPTLIAVVISVSIRIIDQNVRLYQGLHALASSNGANAADSLWLKTTGPASLLSNLRMLSNRHYLLGLTSLLVILSALAVPFSTEVFRLVLQGPQCSSDASDSAMCTVTLGLYSVPAQVLAALLTVLLLGMVVVLFTLRRWNTGVPCNPWKISYMASLAGTDMRKMLHKMRGRSNIEVQKYFQGKRFKLQHWEDNQDVKYGILIHSWEESNTSEKPLRKTNRTVTFVDEPSPKHWRSYYHWFQNDHAPFFILSWTGRILFLSLLSAVLIAVLTYDIVARGTEYQRGITGKAVGVRFLFSGAGVLVSFAWGSFFSAVSFLSPYQLLYRKRLYSGKALELSAATNPFSGVWLALLAHRRDVYLGLVSATAILSEFLPVILGNIPCNGVQVQSAETACVWIAVALLSFMILTVAGSFFIVWKKMNIDPSTIAGAMFYAYTNSVEPASKKILHTRAADSV
ncbi:hypothetical protein F5Y18DRAFT_414413 [Xylariaceae sp. FL1019]|nr:hypothetical protein F5Y18DRAFT_414413 [Xylariaceae sp. FL1019]